MAFYVALVLTLSISVAVSLCVHFLDTYNPFKHNLIIQTENEQIINWERLGDMLWIEPKDGQPKIVPVSYVIAAVLKDNATDNSTDNLSIGAKITNDNLTDNASGVSDNNSTPTEKAK